MIELIQAASNIAGTDWIVRIDDDEFPSARMILFIDRYTKDADLETNDLWLRSKIPPSGSFFVHFDALLKTPSQRLAKARRYEELQEGSAWYFTDLYLPDLYSDGSFQLSTDGFLEFADLFLDIPPLPSEAPIELRDDKLRKITTLCPLPLKKSLLGRIATARSAVRRALVHRWSA